MSDRGINKLNNHTLFSDIQAAFNYVQRWSRIDGNPEDVIEQLYARRIESTFDAYRNSAKNGTIAEAPSQNIRQTLTENRTNLITVSLDQITNKRLKPKVQDEVEVHSQSEQANEERARREAEADYAAFREDESRLRDLGLDAYATYLPIHFFLAESQFAAGWGVYIAEDGIWRLAGWLEHCCREIYGEPSSESRKQFYEIAYQILLRHELLHYKIELFSLNAELLLCRHVHEPLYVRYIQNIYARQYPHDECLEEGLANAAILDSTVIRNAFRALYPQLPRIDWRQFLIELFKFQPSAYQNYELSRGWPGQRENHFRLRKATNYLCNQIVSGIEHVNMESAIPFYPFPPNNYFLRAENLVPIHIIPSLQDRESLFQFPTPKLRVFEALLRELKYRPTDRGKGAHTVWEGLNGWPDVNVSKSKDHLGPSTFHETLKAWDVSMPEYWHYQPVKKLANLIRQRMQTKLFGALGR